MTHNKREKKPQSQHDSNTKMSEINANDVLCGRGGATNQHMGNKLFRKVVEGFQEEYLQARKRDKVLIAEQVLERVKETGGRFLKRDTSSGLWLEVPHKRALLKASQALRENLDVRHGTIRLDKNHSSPNESRRKRTRVVHGKVQTVESPGLSSVATDQSVPDLNDERLVMDSFLMLYYQSPAVTGVNLEAV